MKLMVDEGGVYCCIPLCGSATYDRFTIKTEIVFLNFLMRRNTLYYVRSGFRPSNNFVGKEVTTRFKLSRQQRFASFILNQRKLRCRWELEEKNILPGAIGSASPKKRKSPTKRVASTPIEESSEPEYEEEVDYLENDVIENDNIDCCEPWQYKNAEIERFEEKRLTS